MTYPGNYFVIKAVLLWFIFFQVISAAPQPILVKDINTTPSDVSSDPRYIVIMNGFSYFLADDGSNSRDLWKSDGTILVKKLHGRDIRISRDGPWSLTNVNGTLFLEHMVKYGNLMGQLQEPQLLKI